MTPTFTRFLSITIIPRGLLGCCPTDLKNLTLGSPISREFSMARLIGSQ